MSGMLFNVEEFHKLSCTQQFSRTFFSQKEGEKEEENLATRCQRVEGREH